MRQTLTLMFIFFNLNCFAQQQLPSPYANGYSFPIGTKFTIKLDTANLESIKYSIVKFESVDGIISSDKTDDLFDKTGEDSTIDFYFCIATHGDTKQEKDKNMQVLLLMKNRTKLALNYFSEIKLKEDSEFKETSNIGTFPGATGTETWPYMIYEIGLRNFKVIK